MDGESVHAVPGLSPRGRRGRRVQRQVHVQPVRAAWRQLCDLAFAHPAHVSQLLSAGGNLAIHGRATGTRRGGRNQALIGHREEILAEIRAGLSLSQKQLPSKLFYDERGSELFEAITALPEYYLTRAEQELLREHVPRWVADQRPRSLVELGAGSAVKTRIVLDAMRAHEIRAWYVPVDISAAILEHAADRLRRQYSRLHVLPIGSDFTRTLALPPSLERPALLTFLGSTVGNLTQREAIDLLRRVRAAMRPGDRFLLGTDLRKDVATLEAAYNDACGVTAAFNLNMLRVMNRTFGADFDVDHFRHRAFYDGCDNRIEMHLISTRVQTVNIPGAGSFRIEAGESIRTEISCKYDRQSVRDMLDAAELEMLEWQEGAGLFALSLAVVKDGADRAGTARRRRGIGPPAKLW